MLVPCDSCVGWRRAKHRKNGCKDNDGEIFVDVGGVTTEILFQ